MKLLFQKTIEIIPSFNGNLRIIEIWLNNFICEVRGFENLPYSDRIRCMRIQ